VEFIEIDFGRGVQCEVPRIPRLAALKKGYAKPIAIGECDILPTPEELAAQPRWTFFM
jgi:hypothetical protein